jgi:flagellar basal-body rod protein FlgC
MNISYLPGVESAGSALDAERLRLNVVASNLANAQNTKGADGQPYRRQLVVFESVLNKQLDTAQAPNSSPTVQVKARHSVDTKTPFRSVHMPGHPDADEKGMVLMPNVNVAEEMVDMITASRSMEANIQVITTAKQMMQRALEIVKRG